MIGDSYTDDPHWYGEDPHWYGKLLLSHAMLHFFAEPFDLRLCKSSLVFSYVRGTSPQCFAVIVQEVPCIYFAWFTDKNGLLQPTDIQQFEIIDR